MRGSLYGIDDDDDDEMMGRCVILRDLYNLLQKTGYQKQKCELFYSVRSYTNLTIRRDHGGSSSS